MENISAESSTATEQIKILFVEDCEDDQQFLLRELKKAGLQVDHERVQTEEALRSALDRKAWDIILCDYSMPNFSGIAALGVIREMGLDVPAIIVSGTMGEEAAVDAMLHGARDYILKNRIARLVPAIKREIQNTAIASFKKTRNNRCFIFRKWMRSAGLQGELLTISIIC